MLAHPTGVDAVHQRRRRVDVHAAGLDQPVVHGPGGEQGVDGARAVRRVAVGEQQHLGTAAHRRDRFVAEYLAQNFPDIIYINEPNTSLHALWDILFNVGTVAHRRDDCLDPCAVRSQDFLFETTNGENLTNKRNLSC